MTTSGSLPAARLMAIDDRLTVGLLDAGRAVFRQACEEHQEHVVDMAGDSVLLAFDSAASALRCALAVQPRLQARAGPDEVFVSQAGHRKLKGPGQRPRRA